MSESHAREAGAGLTNPKGAGGRIFSGARWIAALGAALALGTTSVTLGAAKGGSSGGGSASSSSSSGGGGSRSGGGSSSASSGGGGSSSGSRSGGGSSSGSSAAGGNRTSGGGTSSTGGGSPKSDSNASSSSTGSTPPAPNNAAATEERWRAEARAREAEQFARDRERRVAEKAEFDRQAAERRAREAAAFAERDRKLKENFKWVGKPLGGGGDDGQPCHWCGARGPHACPGPRRDDTGGPQTRLPPVSGGTSEPAAEQQPPPTREERLAQLEAWLRQARRGRPHPHTGALIVDEGEVRRIEDELARVRAEPVVAMDPNSPAGASAGTRGSEETAGGSALPPRPPGAARGGDGPTGASAGGPAGIGAAAAGTLRLQESADPAAVRVDPLGQLVDAEGFIIDDVGSEAARAAAAEVRAARAERQQVWHDNEYVANELWKLRQRAVAAWEDAYRSGGLKWGDHPDQALFVKENPAHLTPNSDPVMSWLLQRKEMIDKGNRELQAQGFDKRVVRDIEPYVEGLARAYAQTAATFPEVRSRQRVLESPSYKDVISDLRKTRDDVADESRANPLRDVKDGRSR